MFGAAIAPQTLMETDRLRGDIPRSRWVERALIMYNSSVKKEGKENSPSVDNEDNENGEWGSQATNQSTPTAPTPSTEVTTRKTATLLSNGGFRA